MKKSANDRAFTLAEVLIALAIIGVIAALTVPNLMHKLEKQGYVSGLKKAYSILSNATRLIIAENGTPKAADGGWADSTLHMYELYKSHLKNAKECGMASGCFLERTEYKFLNGSVQHFSWDMNGTRRTLILADGVQSAFVFYDNDGGRNCSSAWNGSKNFCAEIFVDVNGSKKPNTFGRDLFRFVLKENGLYPSGCDYDDCLYAGSTGWGCACTVLKENAMNY